MSDLLVDSDRTLTSYHVKTTATDWNQSWAGSAAKRRPDMPVIALGSQAAGSGGEAMAADLDAMIGDEIAGKVFGRPAEFRRRMLDDSQVEAALDMLRRTKTPDALLRLASSEQGYARARP